MNVLGVTNALGEVRGSSDPLQEKRSRNGVLAHSRTVRLDAEDRGALGAGADVPLCAAPNASQFGFTVMSGGPPELDDGEVGAAVEMGDDEAHGAQACTTWSPRRGSGMAGGKDLARRSAAEGSMRTVGVVPEETDERLASRTTPGTPSGTEHPDHCWCSVEPDQRERRRGRGQTDLGSGPDMLGVASEDEAAGEGRGLGGRRACSRPAFGPLLALVKEAENGAARR